MLKQTLVALGLFGALSGVAVAADAVSDIPAAPFVNDVAPVFSWDGVYLGASAGYGWNRVKSTTFGATTKHEFDGGRFSGFTGYNAEVAPSVVLGVEGELGYAWGDKTIATSELSSGLNGSARLRAGYAIDRALIYTAAGYTATDSEVKAPLGKDSKVLHGWTVGAGIDYAFTNNLFGRVEYRYNDYSKGTYHTGPITSTGDVSEHLVKVGLGVKF